MSWPKLFVALDVDSQQQALELAEHLARPGVGFKVGPRLSLRYGSSLLKELKNFGSVFLDHKFFDIPSTMLAALDAAVESGVELATVHASVGPHTLSELANWHARHAKLADFKFQILAVTALTSFNSRNLPPNWLTRSLTEHVELLAKSAFEAGLTGFVCSALEVQKLRAQFPGAYLVTPGIRLAHHSLDDQSRVLGPQEAFQLGTSAIVCGRPIIHADDPAQALEKILDQIKKATLQ